MNKKVIGILVLILLLVAGFFGYQKFKVKNATTNLSSTTSGMQSLKDLLAMGVSQKCTFSNENSSGTTYIAKGMVRGDFSTKTNDKTTNSHMITDSSTSYIWTDGEPNGFKMTIDKSTETEVNSNPSGNYKSPEEDLDQKMDYNCSTWVSDNSLFTPPSDVTFTDFSQMYAPVTSSMPSDGNGSGSSSTCSYCNALTGEDKSQCLSALNCN